MARTGVPAGAAIPIPCHGMRVLFGPVAVPNWYTIRPCTGQSSWPRSAVVMAAAVAAPRASASRRARSSATMRSFRLFSSRSSSDRRCRASRVLREQQVDRGPVDLVRQRVNLAVQLVHDAIGRLLLSLDVRELVGERVHLGA